MISDGNFTACGTVKRRRIASFKLVFEASRRMQVFACVVYYVIEHRQIYSL